METKGGGGRGGPGQHASRRAPAARADGEEAKPGSDFWERISRGNNMTKVGSSTNPRDVASQIAAQARAAVDCPVLQCLGPQSTNQAVKAIAIARTYLFQSDQLGQRSHPDLAVYPEFVKLEGGNDDQLSAVQLVLSKRSRRPCDVKDGRSLKVGKETDAKSLAGAIANCTREGSRVELTAIGAASVNQAIKSIAIARQYVEEEAIDLCCRPEFVEINEGDGDNSTSALRFLVLVEQT
eukprot:CAMPEP_0119369938 /NCGR_PEP_ID=MMETSP1334-20130426/16380_1 /TAXON_ID=127549 /ORGANISM="Calcidiscus leptoporus, Strain RCC1130" /LENGTH=237 /DNA_ID=CAMNT_0007386887 /DNA_START=15 /DNA_END=728 /DNA_ORIENTATION=-